MPKATLRIADEFVYALADVYSERVLGQIRKLLELLPDNPEMGSADVRESLLRVYGPNLRKQPVSTFVIVYRYEQDTVDVLALVYGPTVV